MLTNFIKQQKGLLSESAEPVEPIEKEDDRTLFLADGRKVDLKGNELTPDEKTNILSNRTGKGYRQRKVFKIKEYEPVKNFLSPVVAPDCIRQEFLEDSKLNEKEKKYKLQVWTAEDLKTASPKVIVNKNPQGLNRFIFFTELKANKNGFYYYTIPFILNVIFLILNITKYNFWANILFSLIALFNIISIYKIFHNENNIVFKIILLFLLIGLDVGLYFLGGYIPDLYEKIYLPFTIKLFFICGCIYYFSSFYIGFLRVYHDDIHEDTGNVVKVNAGPPRVGKTNLAVHEAFIMAKLKWEQLKYAYALAHDREEKILKSKDIHKILDYKALQLSYSFYIMSPCIPCLWSNIAIFDKDGRASHVITMDHMRGLKRLPMYGVIVFDEIGACIRADDGLNNTGKEKPLDISDMFRLGGQWLRWSVYCSEQDFNHIYIDVRRVVGQNLLIESREWRCKPKLLYSIYKVFHWFISNNSEKKIKRKPLREKVMRPLENFVNSIGFACTTYRLKNNTQTSGGIVSKDSDGKISYLGSKRKRWSPIAGACNYNHEAYKELYPSYFDKSIVGDLHKVNVIDGTDMSSYQFVNSVKNIEEKRNVQIKKIKNLA